MWRTTCLLCGALALSALGCASTKTSNTARTGTEQLLITNAVDQALDKIDFRAFRGHTVYLDDRYVECLDKQYVIASVSSGDSRSCLSSLTAGEIRSGQAARRRFGYSSSSGIRP